MFNKQVLKIISVAERVSKTPIWELDVVAARERANKEINGLCGVPDNTVKRNELTLIGSDNNSIPVHLYLPRQQKDDHHIILYFHGGGFVFDTPDSTDVFCRKLCKASNSIIASVDYRLAPEHPFPCGLNDCFDATKWMIENAEIVGGSGCKVAIAGDSAGGNFAAVIVQRLSAQYKEHPLVFQLLIYPVLDLSFLHYRNVDQSGDIFLHREIMKWFRQHYIGKDADELAKNPEVSPLRAKQFNNIPPTILLTTNDLLLNENMTYLAALNEFKVKTKHIHYEDMVHNFVMLGGVFDQATAAIKSMGDYASDFFVTPTSRLFLKARL